MAVKRTAIREVMSMMGRKGGRIGGKRSLETMTPEARSRRARKAVQARWKKAAAAAKKQAQPKRRRVKRTKAAKARAQQP